RDLRGCKGTAEGTEGNIHVFQSSLFGFFFPFFIGTFNVGRIEIPPLRERREDIVPIFEHFVGSICRKYGETVRDLDEGAKSSLTNFAWPGNVRELRNIAERSVLLSSGVIAKSLIQDLLGSADATSGHQAGREDCPKSLGEALPLKEYRRRAEARYIATILKLADGSVTKAAQILELDRSHLHQKLKDLGLA
ncbi:hypothetical protein E3A20_24810, partial [Planctomyces bekefii]